MSEEEKFARSLQEDLLTILTHSDEHGGTVAKLVDASLFEGDYRVIAEKALDFWKRHEKAPGQHIADLLSDILEDKTNRRAQTFRRILIQMFEIKDVINFDYVLRSTVDFNWLQKAKSVTLQGAEQLEARGIAGKEQFVDLWRGFMREGTAAVDPGLRFREFGKVLDYFDIAHKEFLTGITQFDERHIVPMRGKLWLFVAPAKKGKTWALIQLGMMAFKDRKKVLHITLEIEAEEVAQRYYQSLFNIPKRGTEHVIYKLKYKNSNSKPGDPDHKTIDTPVKTVVNYDFAFDSANIREELKYLVKGEGGKGGNLIIKRFPMSSLTFNQLEGYLESLELIDHFVPDMVIIDYPKIMKLNTKELRTSLGQLFEDLRGLAQRRNFALCAVHQTNRTGATASFVKATHAGEDWSVICTADFAITYSQISTEKDRGLARLYVDAARSEQDKFGVLITQSYATGQFKVESWLLDSTAYDQLQASFGPAELDEAEAAEEDA